MSDPLISKITTAQDIDRSVVELGLKIASNFHLEKDRCISEIEAEIRRRLKGFEAGCDVSKPIYPIITVLNVSDNVLEWLDNVYTSAGYKVFYKQDRPNFTMPVQTLFALTPIGTTESPLADPWKETPR